MLSPRDLSHHHQPLPLTLALLVSLLPPRQDCGHPCERHSLHLRDPGGKDHLVLADQGCRNTVFEGSAQSGLHFLRPLVAAGFGVFRIELVDQPAQFVAPLLEGYRAALADAFIDARVGAAAAGDDEAAEAEARRRQLWAWLQALPDANGRAHGVGPGSLEVRSERGVQGMKPTAAALRERARGGSRQRG